MMPVSVKRHGTKFRVVEGDSDVIAKNASGSAADGGGHATKAAAEAQARAINASLKRKGKI